MQDTRSAISLGSELPPTLATKRSISRVYARSGVTSHSISSKPVVCPSWKFDAARSRVSMTSFRPCAIPPNGFARVTSSLSERSDLYPSASPLTIMSSAALASRMATSKSPDAMMPPPVEVLTGPGPLRRVSITRGDPLSQARSRIEPAAWRLDAELKRRIQTFHRVAADLVQSEDAPMTSRTVFGYARPEDGTYIGYRVDGDGPIDIVVQTDWPGNIDYDWAHPEMGQWLRQLASFARVITHDHRGGGVSSRDVPLPTLETRVSDLMAVLGATATRRPVLLGMLSTGAVHVLLAATRPTFPRALVWLEPSARFEWAPDYPWGNTPEDRALEKQFIGLWGTDAYTKSLHEEQEAAGNPFAEEYMEQETIQIRSSCTPDVAARLSEIWYETDVRGLLGSIQTPTLLLVHEQRERSIGEAEFIASAMPDARIHLMPGLAWSAEEVPLWVEEIREFVGAPRPVRAPTSMLSTVMFTDIVGSTERQASLGDQAWSELVSRHHAIVRQELAEHGGDEIDTAGDGFYATFGGPARAVHCALQISERVRDLGLEVRIGVHTGECEVVDSKLGGIAVATGARISAQASPSEVLVSQTVKDLVAGSGLSFEDAGEYELKGIPDRWRLYRAVA